MKLPEPVHCGDCCQRLREVVASRGRGFLFTQLFLYNFTHLCSNSSAKNASKSKSEGRTINRLSILTGLLSFKVCLRLQDLMLMQRRHRQYAARFQIRGRRKGFARGRELGKGGFLSSKVSRHSILLWPPRDNRCVPIRRQNESDCLDGTRAGKRSRS